MKSEVWQKFKKELCNMKSNIHCTCIILVGTIELTEDKPGDLWDNPNNAWIGVTST